MSKVLIIDNDKSTLEILKQNLATDSFTVVIAADGAAALEAARREKPDLILLDVMLPGEDGFEVCRTLRLELAAPILILTARGEEIDKVVGLEVGADDYITKPFSTRELMARIRAMLRRAQRNEPAAPFVPPAPALVKADGLEIDEARHQVFSRGDTVKLSPKEFNLLAFFMHHRGQVFTREQLVEKVWGNDYGGTARTVDVHVLSLRRKIEEDPIRPRRLVTIHGFGYKFEG